MSQRQGATAALRHGDFRRFETARLCATLGVQILTVANGWHVYDVSESALYLGYMGTAQFAPSMALALVGGHLADRWDRRRMAFGVIAVQLLCAVALFVSLTYAPRSLWPVYSVAAVLGGCRAFLGPAMNAMMPRLVPKEIFSNAVAWHLVAFQLGLSTGPALGGLAYGLAGARGAYGTSALVILLALVSSARIRTAVAPERVAAAQWSQFVAGLHYVRKNRILLGSMSLDLFAVLLGGAVALLPIYARDILHVGPWGLGLLRGAPAVGASLVALFFARRPLERALGKYIFAGVFVFGIAIIAFGLSRSFALSLVALFVAGAADMVSLTVRQIILQLGTPDAMRGRVSAVASIFVGASNELGEMESGLTAAFLGAVPAVVAGGFGSLLVAAAWLRLFPMLRRLDDVEEIRAFARA